MDVIDKNKLNAVGHSGPKYSELIETLLAIPWGKQKRIGYFSTPEKTMPCIKTRWAMKKMITGKTSVIKALVWIRLGMRP